MHVKINESRYYVLVAIQLQKPVCLPGALQLGGVLLITWLENSLNDPCLVNHDQGVLY
jgi:hypothetical protein